ncbi:MAG: 50S ribosomal protein L24 [Flavobacteriales bacterium]|nr:50S ribosomal protein L24 [Flavobacteriales bacterium]
MYKRLKVKSGDQVKVIAGASKGKEGKVLEVDRRNDRVLVEGVNEITKHNKPTPTNPEGSIEKKEASIHISNVMVIDNAGNPTRIGRKRGDNGKLVRFSKKSGEDIK